MCSWAWAQVRMHARRQPPAQCPVVACPSCCDTRIIPRCLMVMTSDFYNHVIWNLEVVSSILTGGFLCSSPRSILVSHADDKSVDISLSEGTACEETGGRGGSSRRRLCSEFDPHHRPGCEESFHCSILSVDTASASTMVTPLVYGFWQARKTKSRARKTQREVRKKWGGGY